MAAKVEVDAMKPLLKKIIPQPALNGYHRALAALGAFMYRYPSKKIFVIGVTGTKGKSTTVELIATMLRGAGHRVAVASTIRFAIGEESEPNLFKMTMPGRFFLQKFKRAAVDQGVTHAIVEMTSEGARQYRHQGIELDALVFTNLQPEHLESHGGFERYAQAKLSLARALERSPKRPRIIVANADDAYGEKFLEAAVEIRAPFSLQMAEPYSTDDRAARFVWHSELFSVPLPGVFNLQNVLAALALGEAMAIPLATMKKALEHQGTIAGRAERVESSQPFVVVVDYAHTPESLRALYETYVPKPKNQITQRAPLLHSKNDALGKRRLICVLGATGGGRDIWKRPALGKLADEFCDVAFITNEDPYDEDPKKIMSEVASGFTKTTPHIVLDRREAIRAALGEARAGDSVLISGKGTDPYIMGPRGSKQPWSDRRIAVEELEKLGLSKPRVQMTDNEQMQKV